MRQLDHRLLRSLTAACTLLAAAPSALAQPAPAPGQKPTPAPETEARRRARELYELGNTRYDLAEYDEAIAAFKEAYKLDEAPLLLYNIAQSYRQKGSCEEARTFYKTYLRRDPEAYNRAKVEARIQEMETCIAERKSAAPEREPLDKRKQGPATSDTGTPTPPTPPPPAPRAGDAAAASTRGPAGPADTADTDHPGRTWRVAGLVTAGVGVLLAGTGTYFALDASDLAGQLERRCAVRCAADDPDTTDLDERGKTAEDNAILLYAAGGAALAGGLALYLWGRHEAHPSPPPVAIAPLSGGATVSAQFHF